MRFNDARLQHYEGGSDMNRSDCVNEGITSRTIGLILIPLALLLGFVGFMIVPVLGFVFVLPLLVLAGIFIFAPHSRVCQLILKRN